jgi:Fe-S oxidoreductase
VNQLEMDSPRGRIALMRAAADGRIGLEGAFQEHIDLCLGCRACETACPSGVQYGLLLETAKAALATDQQRFDAVRRKTQSFAEVKRARNPLLPPLYHSPLAPLHQNETA